MPQFLVSLGRRTLALVALLATLGGVAAPVCATPMEEQAPASHCGGAKDHRMPEQGAPAGTPTHHHTLALCATGVCVSSQFASTTVVAVGIPIVAHPQSIEVALTSIAPQHTTPPPRS